MLEDSPPRALYYQLPRRPLPGSLVSNPASRNRYTSATSTFGSAHCSRSTAVTWSLGRGCMFVNEIPGRSRYPRRLCRTARRGVATSEATMSIGRA
jgi:hypothetical protein